MSQISKTVETILNQLGGSKFIAMTGAKDFVTSEREVKFRIGRGARDGMNVIVVALAADETYTMTGAKLRSFKFQELRKIENIYAEDLRHFFKDLTGLDTSL